MSSHDLLIEKGRYNNIERSSRVCFCKSNEIEDVFHFVLICPYYLSIRKQYIKQYYWVRPSVFKLVQLFSIQNSKQLRNLAKYLLEAELLRKSYVT